jgi:16S rRNA U516 pseudouridylate synthase RsuA-like enzyme
VTRLERVRLGGLDLAGITPGEWREVTAGELLNAFPGAALRGTV